MIYFFLLALGFSPYSFSDNFHLATKGSADTGDFSFFVDRIAKTPYARLEDFLRDWKQQRPVYFSNYVMAYRSRSLQQATPQLPRVILFNQNADMVMSFNGHSEQRGFPNIEMMRFHHTKNSFEFYEISFNNNRAEMSAPNPAKCLECHQSAQRTNVDPRPNWEPYNAWLGFYGSIDDSTTFMKSGFIKERVRDDEKALIVQELNLEDRWYEEFWQDSQPKNERYQLLNPVARVQQTESTINGELTNRLAALNHRRVARLMTEQKDVFNFIKWTLWSNSQCNGNFYVADNVYQWLKQNTPRPEFTDGEFRKPALAAPQPLAPALRYSHAVNLLFEPFFINTEDWSMDFKTQGRFAAFERFGLTNDPRLIITKALERYFFNEQDFRGLSCEELKAKSLENFGSLDKVKAFVGERKLKSVVDSAVNGTTNVIAKPLVQRCISCHVEDAGFGDIPSIPFDNPEQLKTLLYRGSYKRGTLLAEILYRTGSHAEQDEQMPPRGIPSNEQRAELIRYLQSL